MVRVNHDRDESPTGFKGFFRKLKKLKTRLDIAGEIEELKTCAVEASKWPKRCSLVDPSSTSGIDPRLLELYKEVDKLVGIDVPVKRIIDWSIKEKDDENLKMLAIVDSGGLGKTASIAKKAYNQLEDQFQCSAFVSVSQHPSIEKILRWILAQVGNIDKTSQDERQLIERTRDYLKDKRYLIVVDDVRGVETWKAIKLASFNNRCGSRIVITTRNAAVASCCSCDAGYVYQMDPLSFDDSKRLFFKRLFGSEDLPYPHLERVCYGILRKCGGLPLAIIIMSSLFADQHAEDKWNRVISTISCASANNPDVESMTKILSLSYFELPHHLRTCLLYLSIFPEDYEIDKQRLINRWIAEGFIHDEQGHCIYEEGENYFNYLINRGFIQPVGAKYGQAKACRVHGIILDFINCKASEENFFTSFNAVQHGPVSEFRFRIHRLFVDNRNKKETTRLSRPVLSHVRSLTIFGELTGISLLDFRALCVLDQEYKCKWGLEHIWEFENHHIANIEKLLHLRYLRLGSPFVNFNLTGKIGELQYLETLDLKGLAVIILPSSIAKLHQLSHLYVSRFARFPDEDLYSAP